MLMPEWSLKKLGLKCQSSHNWGTTAIQIFYGFFGLPFFQISWKFFQLQLRNDDQKFLSCNWSPHHVNSKSGVGHFLSTCCWLIFYCFSIVLKLAFKNSAHFSSFVPKLKAAIKPPQKPRKMKRKFMQKHFFETWWTPRAQKKILYILDEHITYPRNRALKLLIQIEKWAALFLLLARSLRW